MAPRKKKNAKAAKEPAPLKRWPARLRSRLRDPWLLIIFAAALAVRLAYLAYLVDIPFFDAPVIDAEMYDDRAINILGGTLPEKIFYQAPLYSVFLSAIYFVFGHNYLAVRIVQFVIGSINCVLVYVVARKVFADPAGGDPVERKNFRLASGSPAEWTARLAGFGAAFYGPMVHYDGELLRPTIVIFLALLLLWAILEWIEKKHIAWAAVAGVLLGLSAVTRENILLFAPVAAAFMFFLSRRRRWAAPAVFIAAAFVAIVPVTVRNYVVENDFVPISPQGGMNFYIGNSADTGRLTALQPGIEWDKMAFMPRDHLGAGAKPSEYSSWFFRRTFSYIASHPGAWIANLGRKFALFWTGEELTPNTDLQYYKRHAPVLRPLIFRLGYLWIPFGLLAPLAVVGAAAGRRDSRWWLLTGFVLAYMASVVLFHVRARYRLPVAPVMLPFAAHAVVWLFLKAKERQWKPLAAGLAAVVLISIPVNLSPVDTGFARGFPMEYFVAKAYAKKGDDRKAITEFDKAVELYPDYAELRHDYGQALMRTGRMEEGVEQIEKARDLAPDSPFIRKNLGQIYRKESDRLNARAGMVRSADLDADPADILRRADRLISMAIAEYEKAERLDPYDISIKYDLALLYERAGREKEFRAKLEEYIEKAGDSPGEQEWVRISKKLLAGEGDDDDGELLSDENESWPGGSAPRGTARDHVDRAQFYMRGRNYPKALEELDKALELDPANGDAYALLGNLHKKAGRIAEAEKAFLRAIELRPDSLLAHNNLANLYRDTGRFDEAMRHYEKALSIAPDNPVVKKNRNKLLEKMNR